mgnify:CR=1 FL=1
MLPCPLTRRLRRLLIGATLLFSGPAMADTAQTLADRLLTQTRSPAVGVALFAGGTTDIAVAGERARGSGVPVEIGDPWHLGSNGKALTALLVARLTELGRIGRDDTLGETLGPVLPDLHPGYATVTYDQLLAHRAGIRANPGLRELFRYSGARDTPTRDRREIIARLLAKPPASAPGETFRYSNAGYMTAGLMLETATGQSWRDLMQAHVFAPMGLDSAGFGAPGSDGAFDAPRGHKSGVMALFRVRPVPPGPSADNIEAMGPAGRIHLSLADHMAVLRAHLTRDTEVLSAQGWNRLHIPGPGADYVGGWLIRDGVHLHNGSNTMWFNTAAMDLETGRAIILAFNAATPKVQKLSQDSAMGWLGAQ